MKFIYWLTLISCICSIPVHSAEGDQVVDSEEYRQEVGSINEVLTQKRRDRRRHLVLAARAQRQANASLHSSWTLYRRKLREAREHKEHAATILEEIWNLEQDRMDLSEKYGIYG